MRSLAWCLYSARAHQCERLLASPFILIITGLDGWCYHAFFFFFFFFFKRRKLSLREVATTRSHTYFKGQRRDYNTVWPESKSELPSRLIQADNMG